MASEDLDRQSILPQLGEYHRDAEIFIGLVGSAGSDLDDLEHLVRTVVTERDYQCHTVRLSDCLKNVNHGIELVDKPYFDRVRRLQEAGNAVRRQLKQNHALALHAVAQIATGRPERGKAIARQAYVLRSFKRPEEVALMREVYGSGFFLLGVHTSQADRRAFLCDRKCCTPTQAEELVKIDANEADEYGQRTRDTFELCDAYVATARMSVRSGTIRDQINRIVAVLFGDTAVTPSLDEYGMYLAFSAALRSADLARQVGAALMSARGEVLALGCNDVPRSGGGLYWPEDNDDARDIRRGEDSNDRRKSELLESIADGVGKSLESFGGLELTSRPGLKDAIRDSVKLSGLWDITEYGRSTHAEMEALLSCARQGISPLGSTLYATTFPCHNCAKHIVTSGVSRVVYVEPYPKSYATILHSDSITEVLEAHQEQGSKVLFEPFVGIGQRCFTELFGLRTSSGRRLERKRAGVLIDTSQSRTPRRIGDAFSYLEREMYATQDLGKIASTR